MDIELRHLRAYVVLCDEANYTRAAARLHLTQPSLTRTIQQLERIVEVALVDRTSRRFALTEDGVRLREHAMRIVADADAAVAQLRARAALDVGFSWLLPDAWFASARRAYAETGGRLVLHRVDDPLAALESRVIDVAVYRREGRLPRQLRARRIATERRVIAVAASSPLAEAADLRWADLGSHPLVVNPVTGTTDAGSWHPRDPNRRVVLCANFDEWLELIAADVGIGGVPELARDRAPHPGVVYRGVPDAPESHVYLLWRADPPPAVRRFLELA
ncbi:LysR family transcriptional regulator [Nocardia callitridis]|uniref:LysR family transcriptional regulator n=1 Tax=Nocardia callitridis TaxID=648753 RepID=A0ABP9K9A2_9NOCA